MTKPVAERLSKCIRVRLTPAMHEQIDRLAWRNHRYCAELVREILGDYLKIVTAEVPKPDGPCQG